MSLFSAPAAPAPPPPPPSPARQAQPSIMEKGAAERSDLAAAEGEGMNGTNVTGGQGTKAPETTKSLLGG